MNLVNQYLEKFDLVFADSEELKSEVYKLRHAVYCEEFGFEPRSDDLMEIDRWDPSSLHLILKYKPTQEFIGCGRLVVDTEMPYPIEFAGVDEATDLRLKGACEASRVLILNNWRRRRGEEAGAIPVSEVDENRFPFTSIALYFGLLHMAHSVNMNGIMLLAEKRLVRHVNMMGFKNHIFGQPVEYKGTRYPALVDIRKSLASFEGEMKALSDAILHQVCYESLEREAA